MSANRHDHDDRDALNPQIRDDIAALRAASHQGLQTREQTARALARRTQTTTQPKGYRIMNLFKPGKRWILITALGLLTVGGAVFAATQTNLISIWVDTEGKSDEAVEDEIRDQLIDDGVTDPDVKFKRNGDKSKLDISGTKGDREFRIIRKSEFDGDGAGSADDEVVDVQVPEFDVEREPGMTDAELEAKIQAQVDALGMEADVMVHGDRIEIRAEKEVEICDDGPCDEAASAQ